LIVAIAVKKQEPGLAFFNGDTFKYGLGLAKSKKTNTAPEVII
jgi:hypothetical protein